MADWFKIASSGGATSDDAFDDFPFVSRRSPVLCRHGCVASSQPLASSIGVDILRRGGNAADAAVAVAAALAVTEPCSTGLGGDMFCLYYSGQAGAGVSAINGSGASPAELTMDKVQQAYPSDGKNGIDSATFRDSPLAITVPGAARGWEDLYNRHGSKNFTFSELLEPAAQLAEEGFPVGPVTSYHWKAGIAQIAKWRGDDPNNLPLTVDGTRGPETGEIIVNKELARVLRDLGRHGATEGFYKGPTGQAIVDVVRKLGGCLSMDDLAQHDSEFPQAVAASYRDYKLWQIPPNGQGIAGLIALSGLDHLEKQKVIKQLSPKDKGSAEQYHVLMELMRLGFADARAHVADPRHMKVNTNDWLLDTQRIGKRAEMMFQPNKATIQGAPDASSCTVSFQVVDGQGNAISFVNSNFMGFGTGIVPEGCGFTLQNRGFGFTLDDADHPNALGPSKRPYHTIIPAILTHADTNELYATLSNMGGNMQPQGHLQLTVGLVANELDPQEAIDQPRFCIADGTQNGIAFLETGVHTSTIEQLESFGHVLNPNVKGRHDRSVFGRAQSIKRDRKTGVLWAGSDGRADGCAIGF